MKILITGADGFLGTYFRNHNSLKSNDLFFGSVQYSVAPFIKFENLYVDIGKVFKNVQIDAIVHLAAVIPTSFEKASFQKEFLENCRMFNNLFQFSVKNKVKKFIYTSSFGSMIHPNILDIKDFYTLSKITGEHFCSILESKGIQTASLRLSSPYGEYSRSRSVINTFVKKSLHHENIDVFGDGSREQNFVYAGDIMNAIELCLQKPIQGVYNIVGEYNISMLDLANLIVKITNSSSTITTGIVPEVSDNYRPKYDYFRALQDLGYSPRTGLEHGIKKYVNWILKNEDSTHF